MRIVMWIAEILLAVWFFGCIYTYQWGSRILVEGMGVKSPEFGMSCTGRGSSCLRRSRLWENGGFWRCWRLGWSFSFSATGTIRCSGFGEEAQGLQCVLPEHGTPDPGQRYQADPGFVLHDPPSADSVEPCFGDMRDCALEKWEILCMTKFIRRIFAFHNYFWKGCLANVFRYSRGVSCSSFLKRLAK